MGSKEEEEKGIECAVCLCLIEKGDDIKELKCNHFFHRVCLERWFGIGRSLNCPLCRSSSINSTSIKKLYYHHFGENVILFSFSSSSDLKSKSSWWLRGRLEFESHFLYNIEKRFCIIIKESSLFEIMLFVTLNNAPLLMK